MVEGFCTQGGLRAQPSRDDCRVFVESLGSLDAEALTQELGAKMVRGNWHASCITHGCSHQCDPRTGQTASKSHYAGSLPCAPGHQAVHR